MRQGRLLPTFLLCAVTLSPCVMTGTVVAKTRTRKVSSMTKSIKAALPHSSSTSKTVTVKSTAKPAVKHLTGQRSIDDSRATEIQTALVRSGYMSEPTGHWDSTTESAMQKYQSDNGWQTKLIPDSRAIIKLGLGPSSQTSSVSANQQPLHEASDLSPSQR